MIKAEKILHKIRLICYFFFPFLLLLFYSINHTNADIRTLLGDGLIPSAFNAKYVQYMNGLTTFLMQWGLRDYNVFMFVNWLVPLATSYFLTLPLLLFIDFLEKDLFGLDKTLTEVFGIFPYILIFLTVANKTFDISQFSDVSIMLRHFGGYSITDLSFGGLIMYFGRVCPYLIGNVYTYVLTMHYVGVEVMLLPVYAVLYLIKLLKGGFMKNDI